MPRRLTKWEIIERKIEEAHAMDFSRWTPKRVAEHLIAAGRQRVLSKTLYLFPGYCRFPYNLYEDNKFDPDILPFQLTDVDAAIKIRYLHNGKLAYYEMRFEHQDYVKWFIKEYFIPKYPKAPRPARDQPNAQANQPDVNQEQGQPEQSVATVSDVTPANPPPMHGSSIQPGSVVGQMLPAAQSTPHTSHDLNVQTSRITTPLAQSTPLRPGANAAAAAATTTSNVPNVDYADDDAIFNNVGVDLPSAVQNDLAEIQSRLDPNVRQRLDQMGDSLNSPQVDRVQSIDTIDPNAPQVSGVQAVAADPNENEPTQRPDRPQRRPRRPRQARPPAPPRRPPNPIFPIDDGVERLGDFLHADDNGVVQNHENFQVLDLSVVDDELPEGPTEPDAPEVPNVPDVSNAVQPQIDYNDDIDMQVVQPQVPPATPALHSIQIENQTNEQQAQEQHQEQHQQQQQQQQSVDIVQPEPMVLSSVLVPADQHPNAIQPTIGTSTDPNQPVDMQLVSGIEPMSTERRAVRRRDALKRAMSRLGRIRKRPKPRQPINLDRSALQQYLLDDDNRTFILDRIPEKDYRFHPLLHPGPDLTVYFERIFKLVCAADSIEIRQYIVRRWNRFERSCAISALTALASAHCVRIKTTAGNGKVNKRIVGFHLATN